MTTGTIRWVSSFLVSLLFISGCIDSKQPDAVTEIPTLTPTPTALPTPHIDQGVNISGLEGQGQSTTVPQGTDASPPATQPDQPRGSFGFSRYVFERIGRHIRTTLVEGPRDGQIRVPISYQQLLDRQRSGESTDDLGMTRNETAALVSQLNTIRESTKRYLDVEFAKADGFVQSTDEVPNMGAHFIHPLRSLDGIFDPSLPEILLYTADSEGEWELVGTSFVQPINAVGPDHPETFVGPLDNWHVHYELCTGPRFQSRSSSEEECKQDAGNWVPSYGWMIHAWVWVDNPLGVFTMWNPNIPPIASSSEVRRTASTVDTPSVSIEKFGYGEAVIKPGQSISWTNTDSVGHTVTEGSRGRHDGGFDSGVLGPGSSFELTFDQPGRFGYTCTLHSFMSGTIIVTP